MPDCCDGLPNCLPDVPPNLLHEVLNGALLGRRHAEALQRGGGGGEGGGGQAGDMGKAVKIMLTLIILILLIYRNLQRFLKLMHLRLSNSRKTESAFLIAAPSVEMRYMAYFDDFPCEADILENQGRYKLVYFYLVI